MRKMSVLTALAAALTLSGCVEPVPASNPDEIPQRVGMAPAEAQGLIYDVLAAEDCRVTFNDFQSALDLRGFDPKLADPTTPEGRLVLANRFILESTILTMAEDGQLDRSSWTFTSNTGACA